jgi:hypothetical protein
MSTFSIRLSAFGCGRSALRRTLDREERLVSLARFKPCEGVLFFAGVKAPDTRLNKVTGECAAQSSRTRYW